MINKYDLQFKIVVNLVQRDGWYAATFSCNKKDLLCVGAALDTDL